MKKIPALLLPLAFMTSCALVLDGRQQQIGFDSNEKNVEIFIDGKFICKTPCIGEVRRKKNKLMIVAKKEGYEDRTLFAEGTLNPTAAINVISLWTSTFGFTTDMTSSTMWMYQPNEVYVVMAKEPKTEAERQSFKMQNKVRDFVLRNFEQLQNDAYDNSGGNSEYINALAAMTNIANYEIKALLQNSYAAPDAAERVVGRYIENQ